MGLLDYLFGDRVDPEAAHNAALRGLLSTAEAGPPVNSFGLPSGQFPGTSGGPGFGAFIAKGLQMPDLSAMREQTPLAPAGSNIPTIDPMPLFGRTAAQIADNIRNDRYAPQAPQPETPNEYYDQQPGAPRLSGSPNSPLAKFITTVENNPSAPAAVAPNVSQAPGPAASQPAGAPVSAVQAYPAPAGAPHQASGAGVSFREPDFMDRLSTFGRNLEGHGLLGALGDAMGARSPQELEALNSTYRVLVQKVGPEMAAAAVQNPTIMQAILPEVFPPKVPATQVLKEGERIIDQRVLPSGQIERTDATPGGGDPTGKTYAGRLQIAAQLGLKPGTQAWQAYVANGKIPDVTPDHAAIREADNQVQQSQHLIQDLQRALQMNNQVYSGPGAESRAYAASMLPGGHPGAEATNEYANLITSSILPSLKTVFPGRVTNADLKLMTELQGSASYNSNVRREILQRALDRARQIQSEKSSAATALREGTYYKPGGGPEVQSQQQASNYEGMTATALDGRRAVIKNGQWVIIQ